MLNRVDADQEAKIPEAKIRTMQAEVAGNSPMGGQSVGRELTVRELIERRIWKAEALLKALHDLRGNLPNQFLDSGASRISAFIEL